MKQFVLAIAATLALAGCGAAPTVAPAATHATAIEAAAKKLGLPAKFTVEHVTIDEGPSEQPGHTMPVRESFTLTGQADGQAATIVIYGNNPHGDYYVSFFDHATYNGKTVPKAQTKELGALLASVEKPADQDAAFGLQRARTVLAFTPR